MAVPVAKLIADLNAITDSVETPRGNPVHLLSDSLALVTTFLSDVNGFCSTLEDSNELRAEVKELEAWDAEFRRKASSGVMGITNRRYRKPATFAPSVEFAVLRLTLECLDLLWASYGQAMEGQKPEVEPMAPIAEDDEPNPKAKKHTPSRRDRKQKAASHK